MRMSVREQKRSGICACEVVAQMPCKEGLSRLRPCQPAIRNLFTSPRSNRGRQIEDQLFWVGPSNKSVAVAIQRQPHNTIMLAM
eukprot:1158122-Pelagomonas_calceolata.AAC.9